MRDFTLKTYRLLLETLKQKNYNFITFEQYISKYSELTTPLSQLTTLNSPIVILRHNVDLMPEYSLRLAKLENEIGIKGTYYFRIVPESFNETIIKQIAALGHEVGYHYEELDTAYRQLKIKNYVSSRLYREKLKIIPLANGSSRPIGENEALNLRHFDRLSTSSTAYSGRYSDSSAIKQFNNEELIDSAYEMFKVNLAKMRSAAGIKTICMHGSPLSPFDNKEIWYKYDYKELGIIGEPYFDIDWNEFGYLTDTGRRWDGVAVRDKVKSSYQDQRLKASSSFLPQKERKASSSVLPQRGRRFRITQDIIDNINLLPDKMMFTIHPQRWTDDYYAWCKELVWQNVKNVVKRALVLRG